MDITLLKNIVDVNSKTENIRGVNRVGEILEEDLRSSSVVGDLSFERLKKEGKADLLIVRNRHQEGRLNVLFLGHSDTVHRPEDTLEFSERSGVLYGDGVEDMKAGLFVMNEVVKAVAGFGLNLTVIYNVDEERGSIDYKPELLEIYKNQNLALTFESGEAEGGINNGLKNREVVTQRKGNIWYRFEVFGKEGHSGVLTERHQRVNAIEELAHKVVQMEELADYSKGTTVATTMIKGGKAPNMIPGYATAEFDIRFADVGEISRVEAAVHRIIESSNVGGTKAKFEVFDTAMPLTRSELTDDFLAQLMEAGREVGLDVKEVSRGGASDANYLREVNDECVVFDGMGPYGENSHTKEEFVLYESLQQSVDLNIKFLQRVAN